VVPSYLMALSVWKKSSTQLQTDMRGFSLMKEPGPWLLQQARVDLCEVCRVQGGKDKGGKSVGESPCNCIVPVCRDTWRLCL
jgi:hypothetical protein